MNATANLAPLPRVARLRSAIDHTLDLLFDPAIRKWLTDDNPYGFTLTSIANAHQSPHLLQSARHAPDALRAWRYVGNDWHAKGASQPIRIGQLANACMATGQHLPPDAAGALKLLTDDRCGLYVIDTDRFPGAAQRQLASYQRDFFNRVYGPTTDRFAK
jgi:hypothetical protein